MALIRISNVKPGQVVAADVKDRSGRILLSANTELTSDNIKIIKSWGVVEIDVQGELNGTSVDSGLEKVNPEQLQAIELELSKRFRFLNKSHPFIHELFEVCLRRKLSARGLSQEIIDDQ